MNVSQLLAVLEAERREKKEVEAKLQRAREQIQQNQDVIEKLQRREEALRHRLILAEAVQADAATKLGVSIADDIIRETNALEQLQEKVAQLESIEIMKEEVLRQYTQNLRVEKAALEAEVLSGIGDVENDMAEGVNQLVNVMCSTLRNDVQYLRASVAKDIRNAQADVSNVLKESIDRIVQKKRDRALELITEMAQILEVSIDRAIVASALDDGSDKDFEVRKLRFLGSCINSRAALLERALEEAHRAEAKAKRVALKVAQKRDEEIAEEKKKTNELSKKLETALASLEEVKGKFQSVSTLVETLQASRQTT